MDIKQMHHFITIVNSDFNLSKAAQTLHITQPSLSILINELESSYDVKLLTKENSRYTGLTPEGEYLYQEANRILKLYNDLTYRLSSFKEKHFGTIKIGVPPIILSTFFKESIPAFMRKYPNVNIHIVEESANVLKNMLVNKKLDFAILIGVHETTKHVESHVLSTDSLSVFMNKANYLAKKDHVDFEDIESNNLVLLADHFVLNTLLISKFQEHGMMPNPKFRSGQWEVLIQLVSETDSITILPRKIIDKVSNTNIVALDFNPKLEWDISLASNSSKTLTPTQLLFRDFINEYYNRNI